MFFWSNGVVLWRILILVLDVFVWRCWGGLMVRFVCVFRVIWWWICCIWILLVSWMVMVWKC